MKIIIPAVLERLLSCEQITQYKEEEEEKARGKKVEAGNFIPAQTRQASLSLMTKGKALINGRAAPQIHISESGGGTLREII